MLPPSRIVGDRKPAGPPMSVIEQVFEHFGSTVYVGKGGKLLCSSCPAHKGFQVNSTFPSVRKAIADHQNSTRHKDLVGKKTLASFGLVRKAGFAPATDVKRHDLSEMCYGYFRPTVSVDGKDIDLKGFMEAPSHPGGMSCSKAEKRTFFTTAGVKESFTGTYRAATCTGLAVDAFGKANGRNCCMACYGGVRQYKFGVLFVSKRACP
jgi:hypothetical protein